MEIKILFLKTVFGSLIGLFNRFIKTLQIFVCRANLLRHLNGEGAWGCFNKRKTENERERGRAKKNNYRFLYSVSPTN